LQKINDQKKQGREKTSNVLVGAFVMIAVILCIARVLIANQTVEASEKLRSLDVQIRKVQTENQILSEQLRQKQSLITLSERAQQAGFTKTNSFSFISATSPVAFDGTRVQTP
jgi:cell division protein FtsL